MAFRSSCLVSLGALSVLEDEETFLKTRRGTFFECLYEPGVVALTAFHGSCLIRTKLLWFWKNGVVALLRLLWKQLRWIHWLRCNQDVKDKPRVTDGSMSTDDGKKKSWCSLKSDLKSILNQLIQVYVPLCGFLEVRHKSHWPQPVRKLHNRQIDLYHKYKATKPAVVYQS